MIFATRYTRQSCNDRAFGSVDQPLQGFCNRLTVSKVIQTLTAGSEFSRGLWATQQQYTHQRKFCLGKLQIGIRSIAKALGIFFHRLLKFSSLSKKCCSSSCLAVRCTSPASSDSTGSRLDF